MARPTASSPPLQAPSTRELRPRGQRTQARLLEAAVEVFAAKGYHAARVDDIVKAAATSHGTFYLYFANKEDLFAVLAEDVAAAFDAAAADFPGITATPDGVAAIRAWLDRFTALYERHTHVLEAWTAADIAGEDAGRRGEEMIGNFVVVLSERVAGSDAPGPELVVAVTAVVAMIERYNYYVSNRRVPAEREAMLDTLARVTVAALSATF